MTEWTTANHPGWYGRPMCEWYALCDHDAVGTTKHPILGDVPICQRCADKHSLTVDLFSTGGTNGE